MQLKSTIGETELPLPSAADPLSGKQLRQRTDPMSRSEDIPDVLLTAGKDDKKKLPPMVGRENEKQPATPCELPTAGLVRPRGIEPLLRRTGT